MVWRILADTVTFDFVDMTQHPTRSEDAFVVSRRFRPRAVSSYVSQQAVSCTMPAHSMTDLTCRHMVTAR